MIDVYIFRNFSPAFLPRPKTLTKNADICLFFTKYSYDATKVAKNSLNKDSLRISKKVK